jgi:predicted Fe-S protein YdhL (DUF1289 family)
MVLTVDVRKWLGGKGCDRLRDARGEWLVTSQGTQTASALVLLLLARLPRETLNKRSPCRPKHCAAMPLGGTVTAYLSGPFGALPTMASALGADRCNS